MGQAASPPASPSPYPGLWVSPGPPGHLASVSHTLLTPPSVAEEASGHRGERSKRRPGVLERKGLNYLLLVCRGFYGEASGRGSACLLETRPEAVGLG